MTHDMRQGTIGELARGRVRLGVHRLASTYGVRTRLSTKVLIAHVLVCPSGCGSHAMPKPVRLCPIAIQRRCGSDLIRVGRKFLIISGTDGSAGVTAMNKLVP